MNSNANTHAARLLRPDELPCHERGGGARTTPLVTPAVGATTFINGITEFDPGAVVPFHSHDCAESVVLLDGAAALDVDGREERLRPFDTAFVPAGVVHRFRNLSDSKPMRILWTYASLSATRTLQASGETRSIADEHCR